MPQKAEYTEFGVSDKGGGPQMSKEYYDEHKNDHEEISKLLQSVKDTNPKDAVGVKKGPISTVSGPVLALLGVAMLEGARKYGRHNYRVSGVRASVYRDATFRHLNKWWEGEDIDPDSGLPHIIKAIASLTVLADAMIFENWVDDRPPTPPNPEQFWTHVDGLAKAIIEKYPDAKAPYTQIGLDNNEYEN